MSYTVVSPPQEVQHRLQWWTGSNIMESHYDRREGKNVLSKVFFFVG